MSYARSPRPLCSITIGTMPSISVFNAELRINPVIIFPFLEALRICIQPHIRSTSTSKLRFCVVAHQFVEWNQFLAYFRFTEYIVNDVFFQYKGFNLGNTAAVAEIIFQDLLRIFIALCEVFHLRLDLLGGRLQV